jgi:hypothetical protein
LKRQEDDATTVDVAELCWRRHFVRVAGAADLGSELEQYERATHPLGRLRRGNFVIIPYRSLLYGEYL